MIAITALILSIINTLFIIAYIYYQVNKKCEECKEIMNWKRIIRNTFKLADKCEECEKGEKDKGKKGRYTFFK